ncbi:MAG: D-glycero-beta-D-manno-heptose 1,7-bisphosphate 7-phosphatase [Desulfosudaceae bacterium]
MPELDKIVFLDRDGVINEDSPDYIKSWSEVTFIPGSLEAIRRLTRAGFAIIVVTNQSAVGRGLCSGEGLNYIFAKMNSRIAEEGGRLLDIFYCPHLPEDDCSCRKPRPGLIYQARDRYDLNLDSACLIGDSARDIRCARAASCGYAILVRTGNGRQAEKELAAGNIEPDFVAADLLEAALWLIANHDSDPAA